MIGLAAAYLARGAAPAGQPALTEPTAMTIVQAAAIAYFAFIGFEDMANIAEEVRDPGKILPRAILAALGIAGLVYLAVAFVATRVVSPVLLAQATAPLTEVVTQSAPGFPTELFTLIALFAVANTGLLNFVMASRLIYGMSREDLLPAWLSAVHHTRQTPHRAILLVLVVTVALALSGTIVNLAGTTSGLLLLVFFFVNLSVVVIRRREGRASRGFSPPLMLPVFGAATCLGLFTFLPRASLLMTLSAVLAGLVIIGTSALLSRRSPT